MFEFPKELHTQDTIKRHEEQEEDGYVDHLMARTSGEKKVKKIMKYTDNINVGKTKYKLTYPFPDSNKNDHH